ncbi:MAG: DUF4157 domain-containing protein [Gammaproteobacteria bacterium]
MSAIKRKCAACEKEDDESLLETKAESASAPAHSDVATAPTRVHKVLSSPGQPLAPETRAFFEPRFGYDFSRVRVHADQPAAESARAVDAEAYTVGRHLVFGAGAYRPTTGEGQRLLAHELAHVVQQGGVDAMGAALPVAPASGALEAGRSARAVTPGAAAPSVQRKVLVKPPSAASQIGVADQVAPGRFLRG